MSPFLFNFTIEEVLENALRHLNDSGIELLPGNRLKHLDYADDIALLGNNLESLQSALDRLTWEAAKYGLILAPDKCKVSVQDLDFSQFPLSIKGQVIGSREARATEDGIGSRIAKARCAFANLRHL